MEVKNTVEEEIKNAELDVFNEITNGQIKNIQKICLFILTHELLNLEIEKEREALNNYITGEASEKILQLAPLSGDNFLFGKTSWFMEAYYEIRRPIKYATNDQWTNIFTYADFEKLGYPKSLAKRALERFIHDGSLCRKRICGGFLYWNPNFEEISEQVKFENKSFIYPDTGCAEEIQEKPEFNYVLHKYEEEGKIRRFEEIKEHIIGIIKEKHATDYPLGLLPPDYELPKDYPQTICAECGEKYGKYKGGVSSVYPGVCGWCKKETRVTESRDYGYPEFKEKRSD